MEAAKKSFLVEDLKPGMIAAKEIRAEGKVLIAKGFPITESVLHRLKEKYILTKIEVYSEDDAVLMNTTLEKQKTVKQIDEEFNRFSENIKYIFKNVFNVKISGIDEVRKFAKEIQDELDSTSAIIKNIVLYGSGDDAIYRHCVNVAALSCILGKWLELGEKDNNLLTYSAILHDFGKTKLKEDILYKVDPLTTKEFSEIKNHTVLAYNSVRGVPYLDSSVSLGILMHHERMDGSGYPFGIRDEQIHDFAKIIAIADVFDAINSDRVHKKKRRPFEALEIIKEESKGKLHYEFCNVFLSNIVNYYTGEKVLLSNGEECKIIQIDINDIARPLLFSKDGFLDLKKEKDIYIEQLLV
ncbi:HD-GYP domain-containing protein [Clostridium sp. 'White wine YQ']|uniref:HD-GYP domain-containing protein n=1 Tax=Clostridium sp. 'White wine YQ' TaxID=3027474 RepID=UPI002366D98F|nr:HD-GYP domain-containing protein [Clostridium sp. 'White wine YQ']MDD7795457.1 HD-GYP domain-containing protein [Clostridium sp. 'White wine YQ']